jgi:hypothetical protein
MPIELLALTVVLLTPLLAAACYLACLPVWPRQMQPVRIADTPAGCSVTH